MNATDIFIQFDPFAAAINGRSPQTRHLNQLQDIFIDQEAFAAARQQRGNPLVYSVTSIAPADGDGQLHYGIGKLMPGRIGDEYYMTKGHYHAWRPAAEVYICFSGEGLMLLEHEASGESQLHPFVANSIIYVPGFTAHRTINVGDTPLTYVGIYPAAAGHDYGAVAERNFKKVVVARNGRPTLLDRETFLTQRAKQP
ncbi:MAG: hypothetical protein KC425_00865 [Anaerolineales bacterium]|nr:hypothetical protein [Anaerolineales bacterium]